MTIETVISVGKQAIKTTFLVGAPILLSSLVIGIIISIFQAVTSIQDMTITFIPKIIVSAIIFVFFFSWMMATLTHFTADLFIHLPDYVR